MLFRSTSRSTIACAKKLLTVFASTGKIDRQLQGKLGRLEDSLARKRERGRVSDRDWDEYLRIMERVDEACQSTPEAVASQRAVRRAETLLRSAGYTISPLVSTSGLTTELLRGNIWALWAMESSETAQKEGVRDESVLARRFLQEFAREVQTFAHIARRRGDPDADDLARHADTLTELVKRLA
ncbi:MAG: hypothetical protein WD749_05755 [Phycisphaerales bacterium]